MENSQKFSGQIKFDEKSLLAFVRMRYWIDVRDRIAARVGEDGKIAYHDIREILEEPNNETLNSFYESLGSEQKQEISGALKRAWEGLQSKFSPGS